MLIDYHLGQASIILRVKLRNSSSASGAGLTGLTNASVGLRISTIADVEATATAYTAAGSTIDTIATLGTFAAPTATHCRFKEVDATNHPGVYEIQVADARFAVSNAKSLLLSINGTTTNLAECDVCIPLRTVNPYDANFGLTNLDTAVSGRMATFTLPTNFASFSIDGSGRVDVGKFLGTASAGVPGYAGIDWSHVNAPTTSVALTGTTISTSQTVASVANAVTLPTIPSNWITAAGIAAAALNGKGDWNTTTPPTAAAIATAIWTDATAGDFAVNGTPGKVLVGQLGGTFTTTSSSIFSTASLQNAPAGGGSGGATPQAVATAVWQDLTNTADFDTVGSIGALIVGGKLLDSILVESGVNLPQAISIIAAAAAGQSSGVDTGSPIYKAINNAGVTRITATASNGNRSAVTVNLPNI